MINTKRDGIVFIQTSKQLHNSIVSALREASGWILSAYNLQAVDLNTVTTKDNKEVALSVYAELFILKDKGRLFNEQYVLDVFSFASTDVGDCPPNLYAAVTCIPAGTTGKYGYRKSYLPPLRRGFSAFLVALHIRRAIVLPFTFQWPWGLDKGFKGKVLGRRELCPLESLPELIKFIRSVDCREDALQTEDVFKIYNYKQRQRLIWMVQRLIICAGWLELSDANYEDMLSLWLANEESQFSGYGNLGMLMLADLFERKYGGASPINAAGWRLALANVKPTRMLERIKLAHEDGGDLVLQAAEIGPATMSPESLAELESLPGIDFDVKANAENWINIERTFLRKVRHENKTNQLKSIGYFNVYLFGYLPYWYAENKESRFEFPSSPDKLTSAIFVSDLGLIDDKLRPMPFVEFLQSVAVIRKWEPTTHYAILKQVEKLFGFIERYSDSLPESKSFRQPLHSHDYPAQTKSTGTNKRPIARRIFKLFLSYVEALAALSAVLFDRIVAGEVGGEDLVGLDVSRTTIDCFERQNVFGFCPVVFHQGKIFPLRRIPNVFNVDIKPLKSGRLMKVPHPHTLHQIIVSLYTGLRHNHIQWLDEKTFDRQVDDEHGSRDFTELYVNTDKVKSKAWTPFVNFRVIEVLRQQRKWRSLIDESGFNKRIHYNNNPESKWGSLYPLFSYYSDGRPHTDALYYSCWSRETLHN